MEKFINLQIIVKDSPSSQNKNNKNLFKFLNLNYQEILQSDYYIQLILLTDKNYKSFTKKIKNTPALINTSNDHIEIGTYNIINYLIKLCEGESYNEKQTNENYNNTERNNIMTNNNYNSKDNDSQNNNNSNELLHDFLLSEALKEDSIEEPLDLNKVKDKENKYKLKQEKQKKVNPKLKNTMINTFKNNNQNLNLSIDNLPKDEKNMYDNQELTKTRPISDYMSDDKDLKKFWENMAET
jgi:hypothetical protein